MESEREIIERKIKEQQERSRVADQHITKYKKMTLAQVLQQPENIERLENFEMSQQQTFNTLIKRHHKHLLPQCEELFNRYWKLFLKGKCTSINTFIKQLKQT